MLFQSDARSKRCFLFRYSFIVVSLEQPLQDWCLLPVELADVCLFAFSSSRFQNYHLRYRMCPVSCTSDDNQAPGSRTYKSPIVRFTNFRLNTLQFTDYSFDKVPIDAIILLMTYVDRIYDKQLKQRLRSAGAVLIRGVKACGKTETAKQVAKSEINFLLESDAQIARFSLEQALQGETPRLIDEWQEFPKIWDSVKVAVDNSKQKGQFILTGSATPKDDARMHSGVGRFSILDMYPMTWVEKGFCKGNCSLTEILHEGTVEFSEVNTSLETLAEYIVLGGWPDLIGSTQDEAVQFLEDYITLICEVDINRVDDNKKRRDPIKVRRLFESYARNISTEASIATIARDVKGSQLLDSQTVEQYLDALERLMIVDYLPAFKPHITSTYALRSTPVKHFVDASLAVGALRLTAEKLVADPLYLGLLFESCVVQNIRALLANSGAVFSHYRDSGGKEVDLIVELADGTWCAIEIKLGFGQVEEAAQGLLRFCESIDQRRTPRPSQLIVITGNGFAHKREDGVLVVPFGSIGRA